jgi:uncharacterized DUF497 family protein
MPDWSRVEFAWDERNEEQIVKGHGVYPEVAEQVFRNRPYVRRVGDRYRALGRSDDGGFLVVISVFRSGRVRVISARPMTSQERRSYERNW